MSTLWHPFPAPDFGLAFHVDYNFEWGSTDLRIIDRRDGKTFTGKLTFEEHTG